MRFQPTFADGEPFFCNALEDTRTGKVQPQRYANGAESAAAAWEFSLTDATNLAKTMSEDDYRAASAHSRTRVALRREARENPELRDWERTWGCKPRTQHFQEILERLDYAAQNPAEAIETATELNDDAQALRAHVRPGPDWWKLKVSNYSRRAAETILRWIEEAGRPVPHSPGIHIPHDTTLGMNHPVMIERLAMSLSAHSVDTEGHRRWLALSEAYRESHRAEARRHVEAILG